MSELRCDVAVIGGGPAGAAAATVLARQGLDAVVCEREKFPRFHVGESLLPFQGEVLERLGVAETIRARGFVPKYGAWFISNDGACETPIDFESLLAPPHNFAYQVERADFDHLLLEHAAASGARVLEEHTVADAHLEPGRCRLAVRRPGGDEVDVRARWVVDASGQSSLLARRLGLRTQLPDLRKVAHFAHFQGGRRREGRRGGDINLVLGEGQWFWHIPLRDGVSSVGCVVDHERWKGSELDAGAFLTAAVGTSPWLSSWLDGARRVTDVHTLANFSYAAERFVGPGWMLAGDAASFLDPIFSTGVLLALKSGELAGRTLAKRLRAGKPLEARALGSYERALRRWLRSYYRFIRAFYQPQFAPILFSPVPFFQGPITQFLAGRSRLAWHHRLILELFHLVVSLNRGLHLVPDPRTRAAAAHQD